jgi:hypothetical protein
MYLDVFYYLDTSESRQTDITYYWTEGVIKLCIPHCRFSELDCRFLWKGFGPVCLCG